MPVPVIVRFLAPPPQLEDNIYIKSRSLKMPTKKMGCPAKIDIKKIAKFPQFEVGSDDDIFTITIFCPQRKKR